MLNPKATPFESTPTSTAVAPVVVIPSSQQQRNVSDEVQIMTYQVVPHLAFSFSDGTVNDLITLSQWVAWFTSFHIQSYQLPKRRHFCRRWFKHLSLMRRDSKIKFAFEAPSFLHTDNDETEHAMQKWDVLAYAFYASYVALVEELGDRPSAILEIFQEIMKSYAPW